jgi:hypothetical protein
LAYAAQEDGRDAWPSIATLGRCAEISEHVVVDCLRQLREIGLIAEQAPPRQRRPRTWQLNVAALERLAYADENKPAPQTRAFFITLQELDSRSAGRNCGTPWA